MHRTERKLLLLAEGNLDFHYGKTAISVLRYRPQDVVVVVDSRNAGKSVRDVLDLPLDTPIVKDVHQALAGDADTLLIGIAPRGGELPPEWRPQIREAIEHGLDVVSGLHYMLNEDAELVELAHRHGSHLVDVRQPPADLGVARLIPRRPGSHVVTFVGSDCAVGKMTAALEATKAAQKRGLRARFVATGQTGILLEGGGVPVDRVIGDFMAGSVESLVVEAADQADWVFVEGQGSLLHPGYSGVTLALLHGSSPDAMILVHDASRTHLTGYGLPIPPLDRLVHVYEEAAAWVRPARVAAIALNTRGLDSLAAARAIDHARLLTGLPAVDPVKDGGELLVQAAIELLAPASASP